MVLIRKWLPRLGLVENSISQDKVGFKRTNSHLQMSWEKSVQWVGGTYSVLNHQKNKFDLFASVGPHHSQRLGSGFSYDHSSPLQVWDCHLVSQWMRVYAVFFVCFFFFITPLPYFHHLFICTRFLLDLIFCLFVNFSEQQLANLISSSIPLLQWMESKEVNIVTEDIHYKGCFVYFFPVIQRGDFNWKFQTRRKGQLEEWFGSHIFGRSYIWIDWASNTAYEIAL